MRPPYLFILFMVLAQTSFSQDFITQWTFSDTTSQIQFNALTTDTVHYAWSASPSGNNGHGSFIQTSPGEVILNNINIEPNDTVILNMAPENLKRYFMGFFSEQKSLIDVSQWGEVAWVSMEDAFQKCVNLSITASDAPDLSIVKNMRSMFSDAKIFNQNIGDWDVSNVTNMSFMFSGAETFNGDISGWDVTNVTDMSGMFLSAESFNRDIGGWDVSNVTDMSIMFGSANSFNQDIGPWDVSNVIDMSDMFDRNHVFNRDIGGWDVSNVKDMYQMFFLTKSFNQDLSSWDVSNVTNMSYIFSNADSFNGDISDWDVSNVTDMSSMFSQAPIFNQDIGSWDVSNAIDMSGMFSSADSFNQDIGGWEVSKVTNMSTMFLGASSFNQNISKWDVANVVFMSSMFDDASSFNQSLAGWKLNSMIEVENFFNECGMDCNHYSATLIGWQKNNPNVTDKLLGAEKMVYGTSAVEARNALINTQAWEIEGDEASNMPCDDLVSTEFASSQSEIMVYPNPTSGILTLESEQVEPKSIRVYNSVGQEVTDQLIVQKESNSMATIDLSTLSAGIYFLRTSNSSEVLYKE